MAAPATIDDYIATFPPATQAVLSEVRRAIHEVVPGAGERISYGIATITLEGAPLVSFAGWKKHVSLYPAPTGDEAFESVLAPYLTGASTVKFPLKDPIPYEVVKQLVGQHVANRQAKR
ncbi:MAG: hypothetical protein JWM93_836 [Frankiales bacterium]|nr:hypothetical protein [Frankiales bacterium]